MNVATTWCAVVAQYAPKSAQYPKLLRKLGCEVAFAQYHRNPPMGDKDFGEDY
jgi:hypothetical protein